MDEIKDRLDVLKEQEKILETLKENMEKTSKEYDLFIASNEEYMNLSDESKAALGNKGLEQARLLKEKEEAAKAYDEQVEKNKKNAEEINLEMAEKVDKYEKDIAATKQKIEKIEKDIADMEAKLAEIKASEEYSIVGPTPARAKAMELEKLISSLTQNKERMQKGLEYVEKSLETLKSEKEKLVKAYELKEVVINAENEPEAPEEAEQGETDKTELENARKRIKVIDEEIAKKEAELVELGNKKEKCLADIREIEKEYNSLKDSNDKKDKARIEELKSMLAEKINEKDDAEQKFTNTRNEIKQLKSEREALINKYGDKLQEEANPEKPEQNKPKKENTRSGMTRNSGAATIPESEGDNQEPAEEAPEAEPEQQEPDEEKKTNPKKEGKELLKKIKAGKPLDKEDVEKVSEMLSSPENYAKYGLSTRTFKNNAKTLLVALASNMSKIRSTIFISEKASDSLGGVKYNEEDKYISANAIRTSAGIKKIINNPDMKIEGEEYFRAVLAANEGKELDDETKFTKKFKSGREKTATAKEIYDEMKLHIDEYDNLRKAIETYKEVVAVREQSKKSVRSAWLNRIFGRTKMLKEAKAAEKNGTAYTYSGNTLDMMMKLQEGREPVYNERAVANLESRTPEQSVDGPEVK